jgi:polyhydroxyalkanoate synthase subunit PhaC
LSEQGATPFEALLKANQAALQQFFSAWVPPQAAGAAASAQVPPSTGASEAATRYAELQADYVQKQLALWKSFVDANTGQSAGPDTSKSDRRFAAAPWASSPYFDYLRKSYLLNAAHLMEMARSAELDPKSKQRLEYATRQFVDAMSPANFIATNPEAIQLALETKGESLAQGMRNLIEDVTKGYISTTQEREFEVGRNLAMSPGQVVFQNELIQLIQYAPTTPTVYKRPLLMVPPCINKYYIMDLAPGNSLVEFAVSQGHTVFMISWRNISADCATFTWDDYLRLGVLDAIDAVTDIAGADGINVLGFCVGGTLLGSALAVLAASGDDRVASVTLLATMLDFSDTGEIGMFVDEQSVATREASIGAGGVFSGRDLAAVFSSLRANDMVWPYVVNNYLKGKEPPAFDLLFWNGDSTNLPGPMYCYYLRNTYLENNLVKPGKLTMLGERIDLGKIKAPAYVLATREDHIVPWKTAFQSTRLLKGKNRFVLGASGHIAGVINPASRNKRSYWVANQLAADPETWLAGAKEVPGSWWTDWATWLAPMGGEMRKARKQLGNKTYKPIEPAPGSFARQNLARTHDTEPAQDRSTTGDKK